LEPHHLTEITAARSGQLERLHHHRSPIEADVNALGSELAGPELGVERAGRVLDALDNEVRQTTAAPDGNDREPAVVEREPDGATDHRSASGRQKRIVTPRAALGPPR